MEHKSKGETADCVKYYAGVFLCKVCDVFTDDPEAHNHGEIPLE